MNRTTNIKTGLRALFATAVIAAAFAIPAQSAFATGNCSSGSPTASQYCQVQGVNTGSNNKSTGGKSNNGPTVDAATAEGSTPVEVSPTAVNGTAVESSGSTLPFTGLDIGILVLVAAALGGAGLVLRRLTASGVPRS
jgi:hypothetical protein